MVSAWKGDTKIKERLRDKSKDQFNKGFWHLRKLIKFP